MPSSLQSLLLAVSSLLLVYQCDASVQSLINAVDEMEKTTNSILHPEAWKSQKEVLSRLGNTHPSADIKAVREAIDEKMTKLERRMSKAMATMNNMIANLTKTITDEMERRITKTFVAMEGKIVNLTKAEIAEENERRLLPTDWCPRPWKRVRSDLCISVTYEPVTWDYAEGHCRFFNSSLVTFRNLEDYKAVAKETLRLRYCPWVGIRWEENRNKFYGPKENTFVYKLKRNSESCVVACVHGMYYNKCTKKYTFICLKKRP